jgi:hypothetical protein
MNGFEERVTAGWRSLRRHLPDNVAESIRVPTKRVLRKIGVIGRNGSGGSKPGRA